MATKKEPTESGKAWIADQVRLREESITRVMESRGCTRIQAMIYHDCERSEEIAQGVILARLGFVTDLQTPKGASRKVVSERLSSIIDGLAYIGCYLSGTDHLSDRELLDQLESYILVEKVRFVPPNADMSEFIDMNPMHDKAVVVDRDKTLPRPAPRSVDVETIVIRSDQQPCEA